VELEDFQASRSKHSATQEHRCKPGFAFLLRDLDLYWLNA